MLPNRFGENDGKNMPEQGEERNAVVSYVMERVTHGREQRDAKYKALWEEYTRLWRGMWLPTDKNTDSERSKLIAPALQQAIEMTAAEIEEAVFGRAAWFGTEDDDNAPDDLLKMRDQMLYDFDAMGVEDAISKVFLLGSIYGTGIAKIHVVRHRKAVAGPDGEPSFTEMPMVKVEAIRPDEFVIDPSACSIDEAAYCAHETVKPLHIIREKQAAGTYKGHRIGPYTGTVQANPDGKGTNTSEARDNGVLITEYYGKIPRSLLAGEDKGGFVEAIVTVANEDTLLKLVENPFSMKDRPLVAYQHDSVPGEFWGRGVAEKGYNPQKALDAELRARIDALALMTAPMMGADLTRLGDRYAEFKVRPGKTVFTRGRPSEIFEPVVFGNPAQLGATFQQTGDLERMVQMGTGAMDSATPLNISRRNETVGGMSQMQSGFVKRAKRTLQNIERQFLDPLIRKCLWRYAQFAPNRYPTDYEFRVHTALGIQAKEVESQNLQQALAFLQPGSQEQKIVLAALLENTVSSHKKAIMDAVKQMNRQPTEEEQQMQKQLQDLQFRAQKAEVEKAEAEVAKLVAEAKLAEAKTEHEMVKTDLEDDLVEIQAANAATAAQKTRIQAGQVMAQAERNQVEREKIRSKSDSSSE
jgi:hypothetical protein